MRIKVKKEQINDPSSIRVYDYYGVHTVTVYSAFSVFECLEEMITQARPQLIATAQRVVHDYAAAEDIVQHALIKMQEHFYKGFLCVLYTPSGVLWVRGGTKLTEAHTKGIKKWLFGQRDDMPIQPIENLVGWLRSIVYTTALNYYRSRKRLLLLYASLLELSVDGDPRFDDPEVMILREEHCAEVRALVQVLPPLYQEVIQLRYYEEYSLQQTADQLQRPLNTIKSQERRGLEFLRQLLVGQRSVRDGKIVRHQRQLQAS